MRLGNRGQQIGEYVVMVGVVAAAMVSTQMLLSGRVAGKLVDVGHEILGTATPVDDENNTSNSQSTDTARQRGSPTNIRTTVFPRSRGTSESGFLLAEPLGPYVVEAIILKEPTSTEQLAALLAGGDVLQFVESRETSDGRVVLVVRTERGSKFIRYKIKDRLFQVGEASWLGVLEWQRFDEEGRQEAGGNTPIFGTLSEKLQKGLLQSALDSEEGFRSGGGLDTVWAQLVYLGEEVEAALQDPSYRGPLAGLKDQKSKLKAMQKDIENAKERVIALSHFDDTGFRVRADLDIVQPRRWDSEELTEAVLSLDNGRVEPLAEALAALDTQFAKLMESTTSAPTIQLITNVETSKGKLEEVAIELSIKDNAIVGYLDRANPLASRLDMNQDNKSDVDQGNFFVPFMAESIADQEELEKELEKQLDAALARELPDKGTRDTVLRLVKNWGYLVGEEGERKDKDEGLLERVWGYLGDSGDPKDEDFKSFAKRIAERRPDLKEALERVSDPDDPLQGLVAAKAGLNDRQQARLAGRDPGELPEEPGGDEVMFRFFDGDVPGKPPIMVLTAAGKYEVAEGWPQDWKVVTAKVGEKTWPLPFGLEAGLRGSGEVIPIGISTNGDDKPEVFFGASDGGLPKFIGPMVRQPNGTKRFQPRPLVVEDARTGERDDSIVLPVNLDPARDPAHTVPEGFLVEQKDESGKPVRQFIRNLNGNKRLDDEDWLGQVPIAVVNKPTAGERPIATVPWAQVQAALNYEERSPDPIRPNPAGMAVDVDASGEPDSFADGIWTTDGQVGPGAFRQFQGIQWNLLTTEQAGELVEQRGLPAYVAEELERMQREGGTTEGGRRIEGLDAVVEKARAQPAPGVAVLENDGVGPGTMSTMGRHPNDRIFPQEFIPDDAHLIIQQNEEAAEVLDGPAAPRAPTRGQPLNLEQYLQEPPKP